MCLSRQYNLVTIVVVIFRYDCLPTKFDSFELSYTHNRSGNSTICTSYTVAFIDIFRCAHKIHVLHQCFSWLRFSVSLSHFLFVWRLQTFWLEYLYAFIHMHICVQHHKKKKKQTRAPISTQQI